MVIFLTVFEILDIFRDQILPSGPFWGFPKPQVNFFGCNRWAMSGFLYIDNTLYGDIPYRFEILDIFRDQILPSGGHFGGSRIPQVKFFGCTRWAISCFLYIDNTLYGDIPYRF